LDFEVSTRVGEVHPGFVAVEGHRLSVLFTEDIFRLTPARDHAREGLPPVLCVAESFPEFHALVDDNRHAAGMGDHPNQLRSFSRTIWLI